MRVGILSDTHGWLDPRVRDMLAGADCIVHAGDIVGDEILGALRALAPQVVAVRGNNDGSARSLPQEARLQLPGGALAVTHGDRFGDLPAHAALRAAWPDVRAVVYGHTHRLVCDRDGAPWVLNPGAAGRTRTGAGPSCLTLRAGDADWEVAAHRFPSPGADGA